MSPRLASDDELAPMLVLLRSYHADSTEHSGRHLVDHLVGTYRLLESWGNRPQVCRAGMFHSIYGTNSFPIRSAGFGERPAIRQAIGEEAERLAFLFCTIDRPIALLHALVYGESELADMVNGGKHRIAVGELSALLEIEVANLREQGEEAELLATMGKIIVAAVPCPVSPAAVSALTTSIVV